jgi:hypothetical protein
MHGTECKLKNKLNGKREETVEPFSNVLDLEGRKTPLMSPIRTLLFSAFMLASRCFRFLTASAATAAFEGNEVWLGKDLIEEKRERLIRIKSKITPTKE